CRINRLSWNSRQLPFLWIKGFAKYLTGGFNPWLTWSVPKPQKPDDVFRILRRHDPRFEIFKNRGKGSHRLIYHPDINGRACSTPMTYHKGKDVQKGLLKAIIRRFNLPSDIFG